MNEKQWNAFCSFREEFKLKCQEWSKISEELKPLQKAAAKKDTPAYNVENAVVYNTAFDSITQEDDIKLIVIGDNPGKNEQLNINRKYLVGQAGKVGAGFFSRNPELGIDFRKNAVILNKTPVHSAKTMHLKQIIKNGSPEVKKLILESQLWMAEKTAELHQALAENSDNGSVELWLVGYAELKDKGLFVEYRNAMKKAYEKNPAVWDLVKVYQHFSMNCFLVNLKKFVKENDQGNLKKNLEVLGRNHRDEIFI